MTEDARKQFLSAWQKRKQETIIQPYLKEKFNGDGSLCTSYAFVQISARGSRRLTSLFVEVR